MKIKITLLILLTTAFVQSQKSDNYFITKDGEKVIVSSGKNGKDIGEYGYLNSNDYELTGQYFYFFNSQKRKKKIRQSKIKEAYLDGKYFTNLEIGSFLGLKRIHEVIAENENYILTQYYFNRMYVYLLDKNKGEFIIEKHLISRKNKKDQEFFKKQILPHFKSCKDFSSKVNNNMLDDYNAGNSLNLNFMFQGISNVKCNE
ncbi:hypothetical protein [uncultured Aquimarina sp.]|uniref:hypothetical protein n=1 Tax=uncultured Aquimarina sp. TaxID=575652 RepID=UPI0026124F79|nr:hypothetical protein [uncultured Aquimarina sp.]